MSARDNYNAEMIRIIESLGKESRSHAVYLFNGTVFPLASKAFRETKDKIPGLNNEDLGKLLKKKIAELRFLRKADKAAEKTCTPMHVILEHVAGVYAALAAFYQTEQQTPPKVIARNED